jgi:hypothetical protein
LCWILSNKLDLNQETRFIIHYFPEIKAAVIKSSFGTVDTLFQILVWWVTISDWPFSVSRHHLLYSKKLRECLSIFSAEGDATLHDSYSDTTFFVATVQKEVWERWHHDLLSTRIGAADIQSNVHLPVRQNLNLSTLF